MPFSESQLQTWSNQGATASSASTYNSIKTCIDNISWNSDVQYEIYLQGSYRNTTNIYGNSDVDVVIEFTSTFYSNKENFSTEARAAYDEGFSPAKYKLSDYKSAVVKGLSDYYGQNFVKEGNKAITVAGTNGRLDADVICCASYRKYNSFSKTNPNDYIGGIIFWETNTGKEIINYPKKHYDNGASKNAACGMMYKPVTRIVKNMKARMVTNGIISSKIAPSYFIECLLYNVPSATFSKSTYQQAMTALTGELAYLAVNNDNLVCQNEQIKLFGTSDRQWNTTDCATFITNLIRFSNAG